MAKVHLDRLKKKYGVDITGDNYSEVVKQIIDNNNNNVANKMARFNQEKWTKLSNKITTKEKRLVLPELSEIIPPRALSVAKAAQSGEMIQETLRDSLTRDLRASLDEFKVSGKDPYIKRRGATAGRVNPELVNAFKKRISKTFDNYTKKDPRLGVPVNVSRIAEIEIRSTINNIKKTYVDNMVANNPDIEAKKKWIHNRSLSKEPRRGHQLLDNKVKKMNELYKVWKYEKGKRVGFDYMLHPHDPSAPIDQKGGCHCDLDIIVSKKRKR